MKFCHKINYKKNLLNQENRIQYSNPLLATPHHEQRFLPHIGDVPHKLTITQVLLGLQNPARNNRIKMREDLLTEHS